MLWRGSVHGFDEATERRERSKSTSSASAAPKAGSSALHASAWPKATSGLASAKLMRLHIQASRADRTCGGTDQHAGLPLCSLCLRPPLIADVGQNRIRIMYSTENHAQAL